MSDELTFSGMKVVFDPTVPPNSVELLPLTAQRARRVLLAKIGALQLAGHTVSLTGDIPGLFRVDNGPELTTNQLLGLPL